MYGCWALLVVDFPLQNKPSWYNDKINPASKVPGGRRTCHCSLSYRSTDRCLVCSFHTVLQIGGQDENTEGVPRIPESAVLLELISDLAAVRGARSLTPEDPIERGRYYRTSRKALKLKCGVCPSAEARYFIERFVQIVNNVWSGILYRGETEKATELYKGVEEIQNLLQKRVEKTGGPFWHGNEPGLADLGVAPFVGRLKTFSESIEELAKTDINKTLFDKKGKYAGFARYAEAITSRPSWSKTFDAD